MFKLVIIVSALLHGETNPVPAMKGEYKSTFADRAACEAKGAEDSKAVLRVAKELFVNESIPGVPYGATIVCTPIGDPA